MTTSNAGVEHVSAALQRIGIPRAEPAVSVIVPTYNRPDMLRTALRSLRRQTFTNFEVLVINDAGQSPAPVLQEFADCLDLTLLTHSRNMGLAATRNTGIGEARGRYIAYLDDDDYYFAHHLKTLHDCLVSTSRKVAYSDARTILQQSLGNGKYRSREARDYVSREFSCEALYEGNITPVLCVMHERECLETAGNFAPYLKAHEDWDLWLRMSRFFDFSHVSQITCAFTQRTDNTSLSGKKELMRSTWIFVRKQAFFAAYTPRPGLLAEAAESPALITEAKGRAGALSIVLPIASINSGTFDILLALLEEPEADLVLVGSGIDEKSLQSLCQNLPGAHRSKLTILCNISDIGRVYAQNQGAAHSTGRYLLFLEEDVLPQKNALKELLNTADRRANLGALGAVIFSPETLPIAGGIIDHTGCPAYKPSPQGSVPDFLPTPLVSSHCLLISRELFVRNGGFHGRYVPAHYADADLCLRLERQGIECGIAAKAHMLWNSDKFPLLNTPAGLLSMRAFRDRWHPAEKADAASTGNTDWAKRARLWPSDGELPTDFTVEIPGHLV